MARKSASKPTGREAQVSPVKLAHLLVLTRDPDGMRDWYLDVLDGRVVFESRMTRFVSYDEERHRIALASAPESVDGGRGLRSELGHVAFTYRGLDDLLHIYRRLKRGGIEPFWAINRGPTASMYYRDTDGNRIELQIDELSRLPEAEAFVAAEFAQNPIGVVIDGEALADRRAADAAAGELQWRPDLPIRHAPAPRQP